MSPIESHAKIQTREDLAAFMMVLKQDLKERPEEWENVDLYSFLDAMESWLKCMEWYYRNHDRQMPESPTWQMIGDILLGARVNSDREVGKTHGPAAKIPFRGQILGSVAGEARKLAVVLTASPST